MGIPPSERLFKACSWALQNGIEFFHQLFNQLLNQYIYTYLSLHSPTSCRSLWCVCVIEPPGLKWE